MVMSRLYLWKGGEWKEQASSEAALKSSAGSHAERKLYANHQNSIVGIGIAAFVQDGAPCDTCHDFFLAKSMQTPFIFAIGRCGSGKAQAGTGYPALAGTTMIPTVLKDDGTEANATGRSEFVLRRPTQLETASLPVLMYYHQNRCHMGGLPAAFPAIGTDRLQTLLYAAS